jgi:hypothetical protein
MPSTKEKVKFFPERPSQVPPAPDPPDPALDRALKDSFPASDPPSSAQPRSDEEVESTDDAARRREHQEKAQPRRENGKERAR